MPIKITPKDFFLHIGVMVTLYVSAISFINLVFQVINYAFPDPLSGTYYAINPYSTGMRWAVASLIIMFPLFLFLSWLLEKDYRAAPEKRGLGLRKWLIYLTLFVAGVAIAIDLITLINYFLSGEITTRFVLKVLTILVVAAGVFGYYLWDLRRPADVQTTRPRTFAIIAAIVVLVAVIGSFFIMGSPVSQRKVRLDQQKVSDLLSIQWQIVNYWQQKRVLPQALNDLNDPISSFMVPKDAETGEDYGYRRVSDLTFELCANFNLEGKTNGREPMMDYSYPVSGGFENNNWQHDAGPYCFERTIDPDLYPVTPKPVVR